MDTSKILTFAVLTGVVVLLILAGQFLKKKVDPKKLSLFVCIFASAGIAYFVTDGILNSPFDNLSGIGLCLILLGLQLNANKLAKKQETK